MPEFLITLRAARPEMLVEGPTPAEIDGVGAHFEYLTGLHERGILAFAGRTTDDGPETVGLAVIRCADEAEARTLMESDPGIQRGVFRATLQPFSVAIGALNFEAV